MRITEVFSRTIVIVSLPLLMLISACNRTAITTIHPTAAPPLPAEATAIFAPPTATTAPTPIPVDTAMAGPVSATLDENGVAQELCSR
jgi:hypothetical protein